MGEGPSAPAPGRGRLTVVLGAAPGVGKTTAVLELARRRRAAGEDVVVALVEAHGRPATEALEHGLEHLPTRRLTYRGAVFEEPDVDALLSRRPAVAVVDELAHRCTPGSRHEKRWQDVEELLDAGIDVITALNVGHLDSLHDRIGHLTGVVPAETVPDAVVAAADEVEFVDVPPDRLRDRVASGDVVAAGSTAAALGGFYDRRTLERLRQVAADWLATHRGRSGAGADGVSSDAAEPVVVALTGDPEAEHVLRRAAQLAGAHRAELLGVYVRVPSDVRRADPPWLAGQRRLLEEVGGRYSEVAGVDVAATVLAFARQEGAGQLVLGATRRSRRDELLHGSVVNRAVRAAGPIEVHVVPPLVARGHARGPAAARGPSASSALPRPRRALAWVLAIVLPLGLTTALVPVRPSLQLAGALLCNLLAVVAVALLGGVRPAAAATVAAFAAADFFYAPPFYSLRVGRTVDLVALVAFLVVAVAVGTLVDRLALQGVHEARTRAEGHDLARLAADTLVDPDDPAHVCDGIRRAFDLDAVALFRRDRSGWRIEAAAGGAMAGPEDASTSVEMGGGRILALRSDTAGRGGGLLDDFLEQLRFARERTGLAGLGPGPGGPAAP